MILNKTCRLFAAFAILFAATPASLSATDRGFSQNADWQEHWEPCFTERPGDRLFVTQGIDEIDSSLNKVIVINMIYNEFEDEAEGNAEVAELFPEGATEILYGANIMRALEDIEWVANHGCVAAQSAMGIYIGIGFGRIEARRFEQLKWTMLAAKSGFMPAQKILKDIIPESKPEDVAKARAWADAWRPSD